MKYFFIISGMLFLLLSCSEEESLFFESVEYHGQNCKDCPQVMITIPEAMGKEKSVATINTALHEEIIAILTNGESGQAASLEEAVTVFEKEYKEIRDKFSDEMAGWKADIRAGVTYQDPQLVSVSMEADMFTGGAHGYQVTRLMNFDREKGVELEPLQLFQDEDAFKKFAELRFREQEKIPEGSSINSTGFMFADDEFYLPENIGISGNGITLLYNEYEVASYADGRVTLTLPMEQVRDYLKPRFRS
ncbi:MAG: DUF4163 domain-containing protein [Flavobacteriaceae bacterium]|nr:DUF4163 domain-containing protein [Flavobacteriaceae bacterium]